MKGNFKYKGKTVKYDTKIVDSRLGADIQIVYRWGFKLFSEYIILKTYTKTMELLREYDNMPKDEFEEKMYTIITKDIDDNCIIERWS